MELVTSSNLWIGVLLQTKSSVFLGSSSHLKFSSGFSAFPPKHNKSVKRTCQLSFPTSTKPCPHFKKQGQSGLLDTHTNPKRKV